MRTMRSPNGAVHLVMNIVATARQKNIPVRRITLHRIAYEQFRDYCFQFISEESRDALLTYDGVDIDKGSALMIRPFEINLW